MPFVLAKTDIIHSMCHPDTFPLVMINDIWCPALAICRRTDSMAIRVRIAISLSRVVSDYVCWKHYSHPW